MDPRPPLYDPLIRLLRAASPLVARGDSKLARGIRGRRGAGEALAEWGRSRRDPARPVVWFHAPSVGEGLQARVVMEELRRRRPDIQQVYTHFSPSAEGLAARMPADMAGYLPWDDRREMAAVLDGLRPDLVVFTKTEVWPGLAAEARSRGVPLALAAATLPEGAARLRRPAARLLRRTFGSVDRVLAVGQADAHRFARLGVPHERVEICGDPAVDSAWKRARSAHPDAPHLAALRSPNRPTLVAGSTWPPDEAVLVPALEDLPADTPSPQVVLAPHEPDEEHVGHLLRRFRTMGWDALTLAELEEREAVGEDAADPDVPPGEAAGGEEARPRVVVVERVGVLAELYTVANAAYVGGGFHRHGLHSVLEPAAAGIPVVFGPRHGNAAAAGALVERGGGHVVRNPEELRRVLVSWLADVDARGVAARAAEAYIDSHRGAALRTVQALEWFMERTSGGTDGAVF